MESQAPPDDPLRAIFSGKRQWPRVSCAREAQARGNGGDYHARVLDISQGGVLLVVEDPSFYAGEADGFTLVQRAFPTGLEVRFPSEEVRVKSQVVRITPHTDQHVALGCRFERPLSDTEAVLLGVYTAGIDDTEATRASLAYAARPRANVSVLVFDASEDIAGPRVVGRVVAVGDRSIEVRVDVPTSTARRIASSLAGASLRVVLARGRSPLWEGAARLLECQAAPGGAGVRARLYAESPLGRSVRRHFRAAG